MKKDNRINETVENPHQVYNNEFEPIETGGQPMAGSKQVKQENHSRQIQTREG
ncbi:small acid-soluble spore protein P [Brevibacillus migulae]|uniref:small acid-soluble spore protein P n=1 Tax=Brevibacillus migulae TaxID=1644114 RepID=UPI00106E5B1C|nr:small acid-soluble spore protein P [Brevibacillus migulae]